MGHNTSRSSRTAFVLRNQVGDYAGWTLTLTCGRCTTTRRLGIAALMQAGWGEVKMRDVMIRLRCGRCGQPPAQASLADAERHVDVPLIGPGAF